MNLCEQQHNQILVIFQSFHFLFGHLVHYLLEIKQHQDLFGKVSDVGYDVAIMNSKNFRHLLLAAVTLESHPVIF